MKKTLNNKSLYKENLDKLSFRLISSFLLTFIKTLIILSAMVLLCVFVPNFYNLISVLTLFVELKIICSKNNPEYKLPWITVVLLFPVVGFTLYLIFSSRILKKKYVKRLKNLQLADYEKNEQALLSELKEQNKHAYSQATMLKTISNSSLFSDTKQTYFSSGEEYFSSLLTDLKNAKNFIYLEFFIIKKGRLWNSVLQILIDKAKTGVEIKLCYDDFGSITNLPKNYPVYLRRFGIEAVPFSPISGALNSEFNNRSHRKIAVIDGIIGYTGGVNIADEYINEIQKFGHWKDGGIRLYGDAVKEMTKLFLIDFGINQKAQIEINHNVFPKSEITEDGYLIPFGDGPKPLYDRRVSKSAIQNMLASATEYVYITTPYLIIDNELCVSIENTALKGVDVKIILPRIPDKKIIFNMSRSYYKRFINSGVKIYEYEKGFIHAKTYLSDDKYAIIGTINLDYRSLVHHFENGVWLYNCASIVDIKKDIDCTLNQSVEITENNLKINIFNKFFVSLIKLFAPLL